MAGYERKSLQLLGGGLNLLPPPDKTPQTDYLIAQNWRAHRVGKLASRTGYVQATSSPGWPSVQYLHSAAVFGGDIYWGGNDSGGAGHLFFDTTPIGGTLTGNRIGMVPANGWMWIMDQSGAFRHNATSGVQAWLISAPTTACNAFAGAAGTDPDGPSGDYTFYYTYQTADGLEETNPSGGSPVVTLSGNDPIVQVWASADPLVNTINIYAAGGTLGQTYQVATVSNTTSVVCFNATDQAAEAGAGHTTQLAPQWDDLSATSLGIVMPTTNDPPPDAAGLCGPYFDRLIAWDAYSGGALRVNRLFWTDPGKPQYWPGADDEAEGNWVDVGADGERILWAIAHANVLVIYKERSIWWLVGDPDTGYLESIDAGIGIANPWAVASAGQTDYFVGPNGLYHLTLNPAVSEVSGQIRPIFAGTATYGGATAPPGAIRDGRPSPFSFYDVSLGYGMGKLYLSYWEKGGGGHGVLMVWDGERWFYHRSALQALRFYGFLFSSGAIGAAMWGLTGGSPGVGGEVYNIDDFEGLYTVDGTNPIECVYQSHYENCGRPEQQKMWLEVVIDYELAAGDALEVYVGLDGGDATTGTPPVAITSITGAGRRSASIPLGRDKTSGALVQRDQANGNQTDGVLARNLSVLIDCQATGQLILHNVYLYYYLEARLALQASTIPIDLGSPNVKQAKELQLDIDASNGSLVWNLYSDLPGNQLVVRQSQSVAATAGRALFKYPFSVTEGFLWRLAINAGKATNIYGNPFRLYAARLLVRVIGTYVEAYEAANGFVWDSMEQNFESGLTHVTRQFAIALAAIPIKRFREISLEIDTAGPVTLTFITDLPGNHQATRFTATINTGSAGRRFVRVPMPAGINPEIEGRMCRIQLSGASKFLLYELAVECLAMGVYLEAYEAAGGAVFDSREQSFGTEKPKEARELELDLEGDPGLPITATLYCDLPGFTLAQVYQSTTVTTSGRQQIKLPLTVNANLSLYPIGRVFRLILTSANAFRLYGAKLRSREFGCYLTGDEASGGEVYDSTPMDMGTQRVKAYKRIEFDVQTDGTTPATVTVITTQSGSLAPVYTYQINTAGARYTLVHSLPPGTRGRLLQVIVSGNGVRLYAARVWWRTLNDPKAVWDWAPMPVPPTEPVWGDAPFPLNPTPPSGEPAQWWWAKVLSVAETSDAWQWVEMPMDVAEDVTKDLAVTV